MLIEFEALSDNLVDELLSDADLDPWKKSPKNFQELCFRKNSFKKENLQKGFEMSKARNFGFLYV